MGGGIPQCVHRGRREQRPKSCPAFPAEPLGPELKDKLHPESGSKTPLNIGNSWKSHGARCTRPKSQGFPALVSASLLPPENSSSGPAEYMKRQGMVSRLGLQKACTLPLFTGFSLWRSRAGWMSKQLRESGPVVRQAQAPTLQRHTRLCLRHYLLLLLLPYLYYYIPHTTTSHTATTTTHYLPYTYTT